MGETEEGVERDGVGGGGCERTGWRREGGEGEKEVRMMAILEMIGEGPSDVQGDSMGLVIWYKISVTAGFLIVQPVYLLRPLCSSVLLLNARSPQIPHQAVVYPHNSLPLQCNIPQGKQERLRKCSRTRRASVLRKH